ncbi:MAG: hypothetical protein N0E48_28585 [Candidatus Thiodiazotropha endolucinida]|nr:hypothetical protein [Candidatus Thiodiazotropha taylori]MCW4347276.1 hypothetical protein [Candidatus Thiodiazotropha endolucinida]
MIEEDDYPDVGDVRDERILVCHGDDEPTEFVDWLEPIWNQFKELQGLSWDFNIDLASKKYKRTINGFEDLFNLCDIETENNFWEGSLISGRYYWCWAEEDKVEDIIEKLKDVLSTLDEPLKRRIKENVITELKALDDLDELIDRTTGYSEWAQRINKLQDENKRLKEQLTQRHENAIDLACLEILSALLTKNYKRIVAGPIVLWEDGKVIVITSIGGVDIPTGTSISLVYETLKASGYPYIAVEEVSSIRSPHTGRVSYHKGSFEVSGWEKVWYQKRLYGRVFKSDTPENTELAKTIYKVLSK